MLYTALPVSFASPSYIPFESVLKAEPKNWYVLQDSIFQIMVNEARKLYTLPTTSEQQSILAYQD